MTVVAGVLIVLHLIGWAIVLGGALVSLRPPRIPTGMLHGALTALVTGLILAFLLTSGAWKPDEHFSNAKLGVKLVVALVVTALVAWGGRRKDKEVPRWLVLTIGGLTAFNVAVAVLWQ